MRGRPRRPWQSTSAIQGAIDTCHCHENVFSSFVVPYASGAWTILSDGDRNVIASDQRKRGNLPWLSKALPLVCLNKQTLCPTSVSTYPPGPLSGRRKGERAKGGTRGHPWRPSQRALPSGLPSSATPCLRVVTQGWGNVAAGFTPARGGTPDNAIPPFATTPDYLKP